MQRYFAVDNKLNISNSDKHHIINVMRMKQNDKIEIVSDNKIFLCNIDEITKDNVSYSIVRELNINNELDKRITIALPLLMEKKIDFILQKCTELGAYEFIFYNAKRSKVKMDSKKDKKITRWNLITKEAAEQSFRNICPKVKGILELKELVSIPYDLKIVCSTKENKKTVKNILQNSTNCDRIIIVVGPEGGLEELEEEFLCKNDFYSVTLGSTILRAETAPMFVMSAIKYEFMR
ncbi:MAG: 16S rRNA (uracil(1498)-N(3))-methyltransferase [Bacilli bacterium]|nr:16S rRNA (uracil(1498)-N(3))-methyltransferase [Bacilli bacterium]